MKKDTIIKTAICSFEEDENVYIVQSPLFECVIGAETSEKRAWQIYHELLDEMWEAHLEGKLANHAKPGRPAKGILNVNVQVTPDVREALRKNAKNLGISQGDFVAFAIRVAQAYLASPSVYADAKAFTKKFNVVAEEGRVSYRSSTQDKSIGDSKRSKTNRREDGSTKTRAPGNTSTARKKKPAPRQK